MKLIELTFYRDDSAIDYHQFGDIRELLGTSGFTAPDIAFDSKMKGSLETCTWYRSDLSIKIKVNADILRLKDNAVINRVIAHELCHEAVFTLYWLPKLAIISKKFADSKDKEQAKTDLKAFNHEMNAETDHGPEWQKYADKVNSKYGVGYVTKTSDRSYNLTFADRKWYELWKRRGI